MKKMILSVGLISLGLNAFAQTGGLGGTSSIFPAATDNSSPSSSFGGALSGAPTTNPNYVPGTSNTPSSIPSPGAAPTGTGTLEQQRMEDPSLRGTSLGGSTNPSALPPTSTSPTNQAPNTGTKTTPATNIPSATGVGTGSPSGF